MVVAREAKAWRAVQPGPPLPAATEGLVKPGPPLPAALDGPVKPGPPLLRVNSRILVFFLRWGWCGFHAATDRAKRGGSGFHAATDRGKRGWCGFHAAPDRGKRGWCGFHAATDRGKRGWCGFHAAPDGGGWCGGLPRERRVSCRVQSYSLGSQADRGKVLVVSAWTVM